MNKIENVSTYFREPILGENIFYSEPIYRPYPRNNIKSPILNDMSLRGIMVWMNAKGVLYYRLKSGGKIHKTTSLTHASFVFSNIMARDITIGKKDNLNTDRNYISIKDLLIVEDEQFNPFVLQEFYPADKNMLMYRNTFEPTNYYKYKIPLSNNANNSIILEYLFYLSNGSEEKFHYIMNWIASFFQNPSKRSCIALVLSGTQSFNRNILFDEIIRPLYGFKYTFKITKNNFKENHFLRKIKNKLFFNFEDVPNTDMDNRNILLKNIINDTVDTINEKDKNTIEKVKIYGQVLIATNELDLNYLKDSDIKFSFFKLPDDMEKFFIENTILSGKITPSKIKNGDLILEIKKDLNQFVSLLKLFKVNEKLANRPYENDDKHLILQSLDDKVKAFADAIINKEIDYFQVLEKQDFGLYNELMKDFKENKIKQSNLIKIFQIIYEMKEIGGRSLMVKLRKINNDFFSTDAIKHGSGGVKYFDISS